MFNTFSLYSKSNKFRPVKESEKIVMEIKDSQKSGITRIAVCVYDRTQDLFRDYFSNEIVFLSDSVEYILIKPVRGQI